MSQRLEHIEAAIDEAKALGVAIEVHRGPKHYIATLTRKDGVTRKTALSVSPSDHRVCHNVRKSIRRLVASMGQ